MSSPPGSRHHQMPSPGLAGLAASLDPCEGNSCPSAAPTKDPASASRLVRQSHGKHRQQGRLTSTMCGRQLPPALLQVSERIPLLPPLSPMHIHLSQALGPAAPSRGLAQSGSARQELGSCWRTACTQSPHLSGAQS